MMKPDEREAAKVRIAKAVGWTDMGSHPCGRWRGDHNGHWANVLPDFARDPAAALDAAKVIVGYYRLLVEPGRYTVEPQCFDYQFQEFTCDEFAEALALMMLAVLDARGGV